MSNLQLSLVGFFLLVTVNSVLVQSKLTFIEVKYPLLGNESAPGSPWPMPLTMFNSSSNLLYIKKSSFEFKTNMVVECDIIFENLKHYINILFPPKIYNEKSIEETDSLLTMVNFKIAENSVCPGYPNDDMDESCKFTAFSFLFLTFKSAIKF